LLPATVALVAAAVRQHASPATPRQRLFTTALLLPCSQAWLSNLQLHCSFHLLTSNLQQGSPSRPTHRCHQQHSMVNQQ
jgi:hypothetical protein